MAKPRKRAFRIKIPLLRISGISKPKTDAASARGSIICFRMGSQKKPGHTSNSVISALAIWFSRFSKPSWAYRNSAYEAAANKIEGDDRSATFNLLDAAAQGN